MRSIRNPDGVWINSKMFREEALHFQKYGYYCADAWGSPAWLEYWEEQLKRCKEGYSVGGSRITGDHYFYMNFCPIMKLDINGNPLDGKILDFPDFWDGDYNYQWATEIAAKGCTKDFYDKLKLDFRIDEKWLDGGHHVIVGKKRRAGYSYKNGSKAANRYNTIRNSVTIIGAYLKEYMYPEGTMQMASNYLNFLNEHTGWRKNRDFVDKQDHRKASYKEVVNGVDIEKGYKSKILALTFQNNPDAARGKDGKLILFEEAGKFPNLEASFMATEPTLRAGKYTTGQIIIFGTGGDMESGTVDFAKMFYNPEPYNMIPIVNDWDENAENTRCGFFHPIFWNSEGFYDKNGNSDKKACIEYENAKRAELKRTSSDSTRIQGYMQEYPMSPSEAFLTVSTNDFPIVELRNQLNKVVRENLQQIHGQTVNLYKEEGKVKVKPDLDGILEPIYNYVPKTNSLKGAVIIYEYPVANAPKGLYKIGYDPYRQNQSSGTSLGSVYVYKGANKFSYSRDTIVAEYTGRPSSADEANRICEMLAELYHAEIMHENEVTHVVGYFTKVKKLHLLAAQPDGVISKNIERSKVARVYGIHMAEKLKDAGEKYLKDWLLTERDTDEHGNKILNLETIYSIGLLESLILYNRDGNFDRVMAFMMVMFQIEEDAGKEYKKQDDSEDKMDFVKFKQFMFRK